MRISLLLAFFLVTQWSHAQQIKLSDQPDQFVQDVQALTTTFGQTQAGADFSAAWNNFGTDQKTRIIAQTKAMIGKNMRQPAYLLPWLQALSGQQLTGDGLAQFLTTTEKTFKAFDSKVYLSYLQFAKLFLTSRQLYTSNYHRLVTSGGQFTFRYADQAFDVTNPVAEVKPEAKKEELAEPSDDGWGNGWDDSGWDNPTSATSDNTWQPIPEAKTLAAGPILELSGVSLALVSAQDSFVVDNTSLTVGIREALLYGKSGKYTWPQAALSQAGVDLTSYKMLFKNPRLLADEAVLRYDARLKEPVKGTFRFESRKRAPNAPVTQPQFQSSDAKAELKNLGKDVVYKGGFSLIGTRAYGSAANGHRATVTVLQDAKVAFTAVSKGFELSDTLISSPSAQFTGYIGATDSLTHPAVRLFYNSQMKNLRLAKIEKGGYRSALYTDSYHGFSIRADALKWSLPGQHIEFDIISGQNAVPARFESADYFEPTQYEKLTSPQGFHPVTILANCLKQKGVTSITIDELAAHYQRNGKLMRDALVPPIEQGFVDYNPDTDRVSISKKGQHYLGATLAKKDFDNLIILSTQAGSDRDSLANASINFKDNILTIRGVAPFKVSDSLKIYIRPADRIVKVGKTDPFSFNGEMKLDNFRFKGRDLNFNYEQFYVNLDKLDTVTFVPQQMKGKKNAKEIGQDLQYTSGGRLYLGKPGNKSGKKPSVPRLVVPDGVNIYFDDTSHLAGVYNRKVYFKIPKIDQDSLTSRDIEFLGTFYSDGILPPIQTKLVTMADNSLGFSYKVPEAGLTLYGGKGKMKVTGTLKMDYNGLQADGNLSVLAASLDAKKFVLTPDSLVSLDGTAGRIQEGLRGKAYFPEVVLKNYEMKWVPKQDSLIIRDKGTPFEFYNASSKLSGSLVVRSAGLFGDGVMKRKDSEITSSAFQFRQNQFVAERSQIQVGSAAKPALLGRAMDVNFNTVAQTATIQTPKNAALEDSSSLYFPYAAYTTTINRADWDIAKKTITMKGNVKTSVFSSTNPGQEGLSFNGAEALYDIEKMSLNIKGVPFIRSADAKILPDKGLVSIKQDAEMAPLKKAKVIADTVNEFHHLADGNIQILSAKKFEGNAIYQYIRAKGDTTKLKMDAFEFKEIADAPTTAPKRRSRGAAAPAASVSYSTIARAGIGEETHFLLTPRLLFKGDAVMNAAEQGLRFKGAIQPNLKSRFAEPGWIPFQGNNGDSLSLKVDGLKGEDNATPLYAGVHFGSEGLYLTFLSAKQSPQDQDLFIASGSLRDDPKTQQLTIANDARANDQTLEGKKYVLDDAKKIITFDGPLNLFSPATVLQAAGFGRFVPDSAKYLLNTMMVLNTPIPPQVMAIAGDKIVKTNLDEKLSEEVAEEDFDRLLAKISNIAGGKVAEQFSQKSTNGANVPLSTISPKFAATAVLSNVSLRYNPENQAFYSVGKIGISNVGTTDINGLFDGAVEIRKNPDGNDNLFLYIELNPDVWYYFAYAQGTTEVVSSDPDFNNQVQAKVGKDNKIMVVSEEDKNSFVDRFATMYRPRSKAKPAAPKKVIKAPEVAKTPELKNEPADEPAEEQQSVTKVPAKGSKKKDTKKVTAPEEIAETDTLAADVPAGKASSKNKKKINVAQTAKKTADSTKLKPRVSLSETDEAAPAKKPAEKKTGF